MERERLDGLRESGIGVPVFGPAVDLEEPVALPAPRQRGQRARVEFEFQLVARAHDDHAVVNGGDQLQHVAEARIPAGRGIPRSAQGDGFVEELLRLAAQRVDDVLREAAEAEIRRERAGGGETGGRRGGVLDEKRFVPVESEIGHDAELAAASGELAREIDGDGLGLAGGHAHVFEDGDPLAAVGPGLKAGREEAFRRGLGLLEEGGAVSPVDPAVEDKDGAVGGGSLAEIEFDGVLAGDAAEVALEAVDVAAVAPEEAFGDVGAAVQQGALRVDAAGGAEEAELDFHLSLVKISTSAG